MTGLTGHGFAERIPTQRIINTIRKMKTESYGIQSIGIGATLFETSPHTGWKFNVLLDIIKKSAYIPQFRFATRQKIRIPWGELPAPMNKIRR